MNKSKVFAVISAISLVMAMVTLMVLGFEMEEVRQWRMNGERAKANMHLLNRGILTISLVASSCFALRISEVFSGKKQISYNPVFDRTMES